MSYLLGFLPWIVFSVMSGYGWQWAALLALAISVFFLVRSRRAGVTTDAQILDFGTVAYFTALATAAFAVPHSPLQTYESGLSSAWLALIAAVSLLVRRPFTLGIARRRSAPEVWQTAVFRRTSTVLTSVWTIGFALSAAATLYCEAIAANELPRAIVQILGFAVPMTFTHYYVKAIRARAGHASTDVVAAINQ